MAHNAIGPRVRTAWQTGSIGLAISVFLLWRNGGFAPFRSAQPQSWEEYYLLNIGMLLLVPMLHSAIASSRSVGAFGLCAGDRRWGWRFALLGWLLFVPIIAFVAGRHEFQDYYLGNFRASRVLTWLDGREVVDWTRWAFCALVMTVYMFAWEWFFRGYLLFGLRRGGFPWFSVAYQSFLFGVLHLGKPAIEVVSSFVGGAILGIVALRLRSMLACFWVHILIYLTHEAAVLWFFANRTSP